MNLKKLEKEKQKGGDTERVMERGRGNRWGRQKRKTETRRLKATAISVHFPLAPSLTPARK